MVVGDTVYTVNNNTNKIDTWIYNGTLTMGGNTLVSLVKGTKTCLLPSNCVYLSKMEAYFCTKFSNRGII